MPDFGFHLVFITFNLEFSSFWISSNLSFLKNGTWNFFENGLKLMQIFQRLMGGMNRRERLHLNQMSSAVLLYPFFGNLTSQIDKMVGLDTLWQAWECTRALHQTALDLMPKSHYCIYCDGKLILCILHCAVNWINGSLINDIHYKSEEASKLKCNLF